MAGAEGLEPSARGFGELFSSCSKMPIFFENQVHILHYYDGFTTVVQSF